jgi:hypothetical protein
MPKTTNPSLQWHTHIHPWSATQVYTLLAQHAPAYLQPNEVLDLPWVTWLHAHQPLWPLTHTATGTLAGVAWWQHVRPGQGATLHLVVAPTHLKAFLRYGLGNILLQQGSAQWQLPCINAWFMPHRRQPVQWLQRFGFKPTTRLRQGQWLWQWSAKGYPR